MKKIIKTKEIPVSIYVIKKMLVFIVLYVLANVLQQILLTGLFVLAGYDPMQGDLPAEHIQVLALYYGFAVYILLVCLYCKYVEKRLFSSMGFNKRIADYIFGVGIAVALLFVIIGCSIVLKGITFEKINEHVDCLYLFALLGGFMVQGAAEEIMCRGFLMTSLMKKVSAPAAIFLSATAFAFPHFLTLFSSDVVYAVIGIINLYLISIIFSLLMIKRKNIWVSCGLHSLWNFWLNGVMGLQVSGKEAGINGIICFSVEKASLINGGAYGMESSVVTMLVLGIVVVSLCIIGEEKNHGIQ